MIGMMAGMTAVLGGLGVLMLVLRWAKGYFGLHPELARKLLHVGMGAITCSLPWLFESIWPVLLLALIAVGAMLAVRKIALVRCQVGGVLHDVDRDHSLGELFFPLGVTLLFMFAHGSPLLYCLPLLVLTFSDTAAALVGVRFGRLHYRLGQDQKSVEGSAAFFGATLLCTICGLAFFSAFSLPALLWVAIFFGLWMTFVEALSWSGSDNLTIPVGGFLGLMCLLPLATQFSTPQLVLSVIMMICALMLWWMWSSRGLFGALNRWSVVHSSRSFAQGLLMALFVLFG